MRYGSSVRKHVTGVMSCAQGQGCEAGSEEGVGASDAWRSVTEAEVVGETEHGPGNVMRDEGAAEEQQKEGLHEGEWQGVEIVSIDVSEGEVDEALVEVCALLNERLTV